MSKCKHLRMKGSQALQNTAFRIHKSSGWTSSGHTVYEVMVMFMVSRDGMKFESYTQVEAGAIGLAAESSLDRLPFLRDLIWNICSRAH